MLNNSLILKDFERSIKKLEEVLSIEETEIIRDSAIKRFELCFDLSWKLIKKYARQEGVECNSPRSCFKTAFQLGVINYNEDWIKMIDERNLIVHIYREQYAEEVYSNLSEYLERFKELLNFFRRNS